MRMRLSEAVKEDNKEDIKFGASVTASYSSITANSSFDYNSSQQQSREETHKRMRKQTEKLSSEIRRNFKSTFKTVTEVTDTSSKRYVLTNSTKELINYEMRRKMRQVGVQVQDIGTYLCWQTYVDDPGKGRVPRYPEPEPPPAASSCASHNLSLPCHYRRNTYRLLDVSVTSVTVLKVDLKFLLTILRRQLFRLLSQYVLSVFFWRDCCCELL